MIIDRTKHWNRTWWAAGFKSGVPNEVLNRIVHTNQFVIQWTEAVARDFEKTWMETIFSSNCSIPVSRIVVPSWGFFSASRDVLSTLLEVMVEGHRAQVQGSKWNHFCASKLSKDRFWGCYFENAVGKECVKERNITQKSLRINLVHALELDLFKRHVQLNNIQVRRSGSFQLINMTSQEFAEWSFPLFISVARSLSFPIVYHPNLATQERLSFLEQLFGDLCGPVLALHIRRTDKARDPGQPSLLRSRGEKQISLHVYGEMIRVVEHDLSISFNSVILLSDDLDSYFNREDWFIGLSNQTAEVVVNPFWLEHSSFLNDSNWKNRGHDILSEIRTSEKTNDFDKHTFHLNIVSDALLASKHSDFLVGCGSSGVSQFISQGIGMRKQTDGNWFSLWEEDFLLGHIKR
jgi:hypothetical protein